MITPKPWHGGIDRLLMMACLAGVGLLLFLAGGIVTKAEVFPGRLIADAYEGGKALYAQKTDYLDPLRTDLWYESRWDGRGVVTHDPRRARQGMTLYTSGHEAAAFLVGMDGEILHAWRRPYSTVWNRSSAVKSPQPDSHVFMHKAELLPDGGLLALYEGAGDSPYGYGLVRLDRDSEIVWSYLEHAHHSFEVAEDGRVFVLTQGFSNDALKGLEFLTLPRMDDYLVILSPDGKELKKIDLLQAVANSSWRRLVFAVTWFALGDPLHTNDVDIITEEDAAVFPFGEPGQVLLSFRELGGSGAIAVLDVEREEIVWLATGPWLGHHDPDITAEGNILLFDNFGRYNLPGGSSRVIEFDPRTMEIVWSFEGTPEQPFQSEIRASQERLDNGNTLISETNAGRILEVAPDGTVVWEFTNPERGGEGDSHTAIVTWAQRLDPETVRAALGLPDGAPIRTALENAQ